MDIDASQTKHAFRLAHCRFVLRSTLRLFIVLLASIFVSSAAASSRPNVLVIIADQWRFDALGCAGNPDLKTPNLDRLASESVRFINAISTCPVCSPMRASFLTGQRPLTHGVFLNDVPLSPNAITISKVLKGHGYDSAYIGKWHLNGDGRSAFIPRDRRQGFDYWKVLECTHDYNHSAYYADLPEKLEWDGYDAIAQTRDAQSYLRARARSKKPFFMVVAWGPPHDPYFTAPEKYRRLYDPEKLALRPNVPGKESANARKILAGYYAHGSALDDCVGQLRETLEQTGLLTNTIIVFTSDHGDMLGSHGLYKKQKPYDESIRVPLMFYVPISLSGHERARDRKPTTTSGPIIDSPIASEDLMPTMLGLCGISSPKTVEGIDFSPVLLGKKRPPETVDTIMCPAPFGEWDRKHGGREYRGIRTSRYTYVRDLQGPWLLFDNITDPFQTNNLVGLSSSSKLKHQMETLLTAKLKEQHDQFLPADRYIKQWHYAVDANGTVPYRN